MAEIQIAVTGLAELEARLIELGRNGGRRALRKGLRAGANVGLKEARARVRKRTGDTAKKTRVKDQGVRGDEATMSVTTSYVGRFLELGTSKMAAKPFIRPAFESRAGDIVDEVRDVALAAVELEALKR